MFLFIADIHIKLGQKNVPKDWQRNRFSLLADKINNTAHSTLIIGGDLLDVADPSIEEVGLLYDFLKAINTPIILIPGNHELVNKTTDCYVYIESMLKDLNVTVIRDFQHIDGIDYIPYNILHSTSKFIDKRQSNIAVTHVRGEIPPHVLPEVDLDKCFSQYDVVFAGDLHAKSNSQKNILYPGSPMVTSFHRNKASGENGGYLFSVNPTKIEWIEFDLPQLIRKTVTTEAEIVPTTPDHTIYELQGSIEDLAKIKTTELLDKKVTKDLGSAATLNMSGDIVEELALYLSEIKRIGNTEQIISVFKEITKDDSNT